MEFNKIIGYGYTGPLLVIQISIVVQNYLD